MILKHLHNIFTQEGVTYNREDFGVLVNSGYPDIRRVINGSKTIHRWKVSIDKQSIVENDYKMKLLEILKR